MLKSESLDLKERAADVLGHTAPKLSERLLNEVALKDAINLVHDENE